MRTSAVRILQEFLTTEGLYTGKIDGDRGPKTHAAAKQLITKRQDEIEGDPIDWSGKRSAVAAYQLHIKDKGIDVGAIDGLWGSQTEFGHGALEEMREFGQPQLWRDIIPGDENPHDWPLDTPDQGNLKAFYGEPGNPDCTRGKVICPWPLKLAWDKSKTVSRISCHIKVEASLNSVLQAVAAKYSGAEIEELGLDLFGGCFNKRKKRGGSTWSTHSWGMALDFDPARNRLKWGRDRASFARPEYIPWWECWETEGWVSLGRERNFDWMHVQAAKI